MSNTNHDEAAILAEMFSYLVPAGKVRYWVPDGQEGGCIEYVTPEEAAKRDRELEAWDEGGERPDWM